jgi:hypothetical protein
MTDTARPWRITWQGMEWTEDGAGLTAGDVCRLQVLVGDGWASIDPRRSPLHLVSMIAVLASKVAGVDPVELLPVIQATPAEEFLGALGVS